VSKVVNSRVDKSRELLLLEQLLESLIFSFSMKLPAHLMKSLKERFNKL